MKIKFSSTRFNTKGRFYTLLIFSMLLSFTLVVKAQNNPATPNSDSLNKANQLKIQNDSLEAAKKKSSAAASSAKAQKPRDTRPISQRIDFDIYTSFWANSSSTFFEFSPVIAYKFPKIVSIGAGPTYVYNHDRINDVDLNGWGGKVFSRAQLTKWFYVYTEYQGINNQYISGINGTTLEVTKSKEYVDSWFLSLGLNIRLTKRHGINFQALYDVLYDENTSPYYGAWTYRIGFGF